MKNDLEKLKNAKPLSDSQVLSAAQKLIKEYSFNLNDKSYNLLFNDEDLQDIDTLRLEVNSLLNSRVAQLYTHFASWVAKIAIQTEQGVIAGITGDLLWKKCRNTDSDVSKVFCNTKPVRAAYAEHEIAKGKKDPKVKQFEHALAIENAKVPIWPALTMLERTKTFKFDSVRNAVKSKTKK